MTEPKYYFITDFYHPGIPHKEFITKLFKTRYPMDYYMAEEYPDKYPVDKVKSSNNLFKPDVMDWGTKEGPKGDRELYKGRRMLFQFWTKEYIDGLVKYLEKNHKKTDLILEVGAGNGELSRELSKRGFNILATDNYVWATNQDKNFVIKMDYKEALKKYQPKVVLCSWMMLGQNWTPAFRRTKSVKEYILIGEADGGACGNEGAFDVWPGWKLNDGFDFDKYNICRTDSLDNPKVKNASIELKHSITLGFEKISVPHPLQTLWFNADTAILRAWKRSWGIRYRLRYLFDLKTHLTSFKYLLFKNKYKNTKNYKMWGSSRESSKIMRGLTNRLKGMNKEMRRKENPPLWMKLKRFFRQKGY